MRVYISIDAEGCTGIFKFAQVLSGHPEYEFCRRMMEGDANAAIRGAFKAGAADVLVNDSHDNGDNIRIENLDPRARLISGSAKPMSMMEGLDNTFDAAMLLGYHSRKSEYGVISHTFSYGRIFEVKINGRLVGEAEINGFAAGTFGVPVVFLSGDQYVTENIESVIPGIKTVATKRAVGCGAAECAHPTVIRERIEEGVYAALSGLKNSPVKPLNDAPYTLDVRFATTSHAALALRLPGSELTGPTTVRYETGDYTALYRGFLCMATLSSAFDERN
jgi:D-amino peptidase